MNTHFSSPLKEVISLSREEAIRLHSDVIGTGHLLLVLRPELRKEIEAGITAEQGSAADAGKTMIIKKIGLFSLFRRNRDGLLLSGRTGMCLSREAEKAIRGAIWVAKDRQSAAVEPEHLMLSILKDTDDKWRAILINPL
jgi:ATP-dependent Clp protease ATP-binding subunit ClpC